MFRVTSPSLLTGAARAGRAADAARASSRRCLPLPLLALMVAACSPDRIVGSGELPNDLLDPAAARTPAGAMAAYRGALVQLGGALAGYTLPGSANGSFIATTGLLSDELQAGDIGAPIGTTSAWELVDARILPEYTDPSVEPAVAYRTTYSALQRVRAHARQAIGLVRAYLPGSSVQLRGHLYAVLGYSEVMLAELFCSGIPLTTVDYDGNYTLEAGSTTQEVLEHAVALFDTALAMSADSIRIANLARVGKARALLDLGEYRDAAEVAAAVPDDFRYLETFFGTDQASTDVFTNFGYIAPGLPWFATVADLEGGTGLAYISSGDPRTAATAAGGMNQYGATMYFPTKYAPTGDSPIVLASGVEARLIEAEAELQAGEGRWLATLNALRTDGTYETRPNAQDSTRTDTLWHAGTGGVAGLRPVSDPGTAEGRVDLLFRERASWLFLTGHRLGDLRRLVRQYGRQPNAVFPTGRYPGGNAAYGSDVNAPIPASERAFNPKFTGCINRGA